MTAREPSRLRILHVLDHACRFNGMAHAAVDLACSQALLSHDVALWSGKGDFDELLTECGVSVQHSPGLSGPLSVPRAARNLAALCHSFRPDIVHGHMVRSTLIAWPITRILGITFVTCVQNSFSRFAPIMGIGDVVITGCEAVAAEMKQRWISARKLRPILNGTIGSPRIGNTTPQPACLQRPAVITMCGLHPRKGVDYLIRGFETSRRSNPALHLYILGEGPMEAEYRQMVSADHADHIHFLGAAKDPRPWLLGADAFVLASLSDPAPLAICEARAAGLAMVGTNVDGIPELLEDGRAGMLIPPRSSDEIAAALNQLFSSPAILNGWRTKSQINIDRLSVKRVAEETVKVYRETLRARQGGSARAGMEQTAA